MEEENLGEELKQNPENREGLLKLLTKAVGLDITAIPLPVSLNEPTSFLQKMTEAIFHADTLLSKVTFLTKSILFFKKSFIITGK